MNESLDYPTFQEYAFAIVDASMVEHLPVGLATEVLVPKGLVFSAHLMPTLIDLGRTSSTGRDALFEYFHDLSIHAHSPSLAPVLIRTRASAASMLRHWNSMQLMEPRPGRRLWLRLHDSRVLHQMLRVLSLPQRGRLFGVSEMFTYWVGGAWVLAKREMGGLSNQVDGISPSTSSSAWPIAWNCERIERIGLVNRALHHAGVVGASALTSKGAIAEQFIERALKHGLVDHADLVEFATRGLTTHSSFDEHPKVAGAIGPPSDGQSSLSDRFALIPDYVWTELRQTKPMQGEL